MKERTQEDILDALAGAFEFLSWEAEDPELPCSERKYSLRVANALMGVYQSIAPAFLSGRKEEALKILRNKKEYLKNHSGFWADFLELIEKHLTDHEA